MKHFLTTFILLFAALVPACAESVLEIQCSGLRKGENAIYRVYDSSDRLLYTVSLQGMGSYTTVSRRITGLTAGTYRVTDMNWDWSYEVTAPSVTQTVEDGGTATFVFQAVKRSGTGTHFEDSEVNKFE